MWKGIKQMDEYKERAVNKKIRTEIKTRLIVKKK